MKSIKAMLITLLLSLTLCACQEVPEEVKKNMKEYGENAQKKASEVTYCSVEELRKTKLSEQSDSNIVFPKEVDFSDVEEVGVLQLTIEKNFHLEKNIKKYAKLFGVNRADIKKEDSGAGSWGNIISYDSEKDKVCFSMIENGGMAYMRDDSYDNTPNVIENRYSTDKDDLSQVNISLSDGEVNLAKMCKDTEKWLDENMYVDGIKHKISDVYVRKMGDKTKLSMCAEYDYKGICFSNHTFPLVEENDDFSQKLLTTSHAEELEYTDTKSPTYFSRNMEISIDSVEPVTKIVDYESAQRIVKETMSGFGVFHVSEAIPLYFMFLKDYEEAPGKKIEARPVYAFLVTEKSEDMNLGVLKSSQCTHFFLVDMVTGEFTTDLDE